MSGARHSEGGESVRERAFAFAVHVVKLCRHLEDKSGVSRTLSKQLFRAGTSIAANLEEAQGGQSKADFISKNAIALKESRETSYWLRLLVASEVVHEARVAELQSEVDELTRIIAAIIVSAKKSGV